MRRHSGHPVPATVRELSDVQLEAIVLRGDTGQTGTAVIPRRRSKRLPICPPHLNPAAAAEWRRIAKALQRAGVLTTFDRAALAAYCQAWGRWVEAEERLRETPPLVKTPSGYVQQSPWLTIAHKQLELMGRYMVELGLTPAARSRVMAGAPIACPGATEPLEIRRVIVTPGEDGGPSSEEVYDTWLAKQAGTG